jgi:hypothetical protein
LAAEDVVAVEVVDGVLHSTDPAKLVLTLGADHMVAATFLLFDNKAALWTISHLSFVFETIKINFHGVV